MSTPAALSDMDKTFPAWDAAAVEADLKAAAGACRRLDRRARKALTSVSLAARAPTIRQAVCRERKSSWAPKRAPPA